MESNFEAQIPTDDHSSVGTGRDCAAQVDPVVEAPNTVDTMNANANTVSAENDGNHITDGGVEDAAPPSHSTVSGSEANNVREAASSDASQPPPAPPAAKKPFLLAEHQARLSQIMDKVKEARGYRSVINPAEMGALGFPKTMAARIPALGIPIWDVFGNRAFYQLRPDKPRYNQDGKPIKYETPRGQNMVVDVNPGIRHLIGDPSIPLWITEGPIKADVAISQGLLCVALLGVWNWRGTNEAGGKTALPDWEQFAFNGRDGKARDVRIVFDSDVVRNPSVMESLSRFGDFLTRRGAQVTVIYLPEGGSGEKVGLDDFFANGGTLEDLDRLAAQSQQNANAAPEAPPLSPSEIRDQFQRGCRDIAPPLSLEGTKAVFRRYLHMEDDSLLEILLAIVTANLGDGDPVWGMLVGAPSGGKTEFLNPFSSLPFVHRLATVTEAALLSGSSKKDHAVGAKGGLLKEMGSFGFLLIKDFTSVLSMRRDSASGVLGAMREIYDGSWTRRVGTDGGLELEWKGKAAVLGGCTEILDRHSETVGSMGERLVFFRLPQMSRKAMGRRALLEAGKETEMREALKEAVAGFFAGFNVPAKPEQLSNSEVERMVDLGELAARCRSAVPRDSHSRGISIRLESEAPTRFIKILHRLFSGLVHVGVERERAWLLTAKVAFDSMGKNRRGALMHLLANPSEGATNKEVGEKIFLPDSLARRTMEDLWVHAVVQRGNSVNPNGKGGSQDKWFLTREALFQLEAIFGADWDAGLAMCFPESREAGAMPTSRGPVVESQPLYERGAGRFPEEDRGEMDGADTPYNNELADNGNDDYEDEDDEDKSRADVFAQLEEAHRASAASLMATLERSIEASLERDMVHSNGQNGNGHNGSAPTH